MTVNDLPYRALRPICSFYHQFSATCQKDVKRVCCHNCQEGPLATLSLHISDAYYRCFHSPWSESVKYSATTPSQSAHFRFWIVRNANFKSLSIGMWDGVATLCRKCPNSTLYPEASTHSSFPLFAKYESWRTRLVACFGLSFPSTMQVAFSSCMTHFLC